LTTLNEGKIIVFTTDRASSRKRAILERKGAEVIEIPGHSRLLELPIVLARLGERGIASLLVEGGSRLLTAMIEQRLADKLFLTMSPRLIGGEAAPSFLGGKGVRLVRSSLRLERVCTFPIGDDLIIQGNL
jgi:diaminohydroxyphosphoribosylaminopyrimidine deaminase/5-amino-6-(5-phosphoribosylamino)uracil reductase